MKKLRALFKKFRWKSLRLKGQMYMVYALAVIVPILIIGSILVFNAEKMLNKYYMEMLQTENARVKSTLSQMTVQAYHISDEICLDREEKQILSTKYTEPVKFSQKVNELSEIDNIKYNSTQISGIYIYSDNPTITNYKQYNKVTAEIYNTEWYQRAMEDTTPFWAEIEDEQSNGANNNSMALVRRILLPDSDYKAILIVKLGDSYIRNRISSNVIDVMALNEGNILYSSTLDWYGKPMPVDIDYNNRYFSYSSVENIDGTTYFMSLTTSNLYMTDSRLYICTMNDSNFDDIRSITNALVVVLALAILVPGIILLAYTQRFTGRVYLLREEMHKASIKDFDMASSFPGHDELTDAYNDLRKMVDDIKETQAKMYEAELNEKELRNNQQVMEYKMLASQINPHYLYNTLETIRMKSLTMGNKEVADCIKILGKTLQYVLKNTGTTSTTLAKEIEHVENYLTIQRMRFGDRINFTMNIAEGINTEGYYVLPLLLQPIVENAVIHGLEHIESNGHIDVEIELTDDEKIKMTVSDNGQGMKQDEYELMREKLNTPGLKLESSIGVYNICERIRLHYGEEYGLYIESEYGKGTKVIMTLPIITTRF